MNSAFAKSVKTEIHLQKYNRNKCTLSQINDCIKHLQSPGNRKAIIHANLE